MKKILKIVLLSALFLLLGCIFFVFIQLHLSLPKIKGKIFLEGLTADVKVIRDEWGVPHLLAQNEKDLFFACGYIHAQERMWQMELSRRAGFGRLSEIFGKRTIETDKLMRNLGLKEAVRRDLEKLSPEMMEIVQSYGRGVNAWLNSRRLDWPPEFMILRFRPQPWSPLDSLIIKELLALTLSVDFRSEALRGMLVKKFGPERALDILEEGITRVYSEAEEASMSLALAHPPSESNNWVLSGSRTESGKPLLANDPHLEITLPPIWFEIHLSCPDLDVSGVSLPGIPLVIIGHNESIAWGMTNSYVDVQDLYLEKLDSSGKMYLDPDGWKPLVRQEEIIQVRGQRQPERMEIHWTARGPIVSPLVIESSTPLSLGWTIYEGGKTAESFYCLNKAQNWQEFAEALRLFDVPSQNFVYADKEGNIGYYLSGKIPLRDQVAALFPFPGWREEGRWKGFLDEDKKPNLYNPEKGFIITANNKIIPDDYPYYLSFDWFPPYRAKRIEELIIKEEKHSVDSLKRIQNDVFSKDGEFFLPHILEIKLEDKKAQEALEVLKTWDCKMSSGKGAALYHAFMKFFPEEIFGDDFGEDYQKFKSLLSRKQSGLVKILSEPSSPWFDRKETPEVEKRGEIVEMSLQKAYEWMEKQYGSPDKWDYTRLNSFLFRHALGEVPLLRFFNRGPFPMDGSDFTVRVSFPVEKGYVAASCRLIVDLSDFKNSVCVLSSGESGHFRSRFYDNQISLWLKGQYHPMLVDSKDIEARSAGTLMLKASSRNKDVP